MDDTGSDWLPVSDRANSTQQIVPVDGGFLHCYYDNSSSHTIRRYRWDVARPGTPLPEDLVE